MREVKIAWSNNPNNYVSIREIKHLEAIEKILQIIEKENENNLPKEIR